MSVVNMMRQIRGSQTLLAATNGANHALRGSSMMDFIGELRGKNLACFCSDCVECHADVLLSLANGNGAA